MNKTREWERGWSDAESYYKILHGKELKNVEDTTRSDTLREVLGEQLADIEMFLETASGKRDIKKVLTAIKADLEVRLNQVKEKA